MTVMETEATQSQVTDLACEALKMRNADHEHLNRIYAYLHGKTDAVYIPRDAREEYRWVANQARVNVLPLVVDTLAQSLFVDGYRSPDSEGNAETWDQWQANRMDARQTGVHRAALAYGTSFVQVLPGDRAPAWQPFSPRQMTCSYVDTVNDEWPQWALVTKSNGESLDLVLTVADWRHKFTAKNAEAKPVLVDSQWHGVPWCPVTRFSNSYDLDGVVGEVDPLIPLQDQINLTTFNMLMTQIFAAFRQKWVTGFDVPKDEQGRPVEPFKSAVNRLFVAESPDSRFGSFDSSDLNQYLAARESTLRNLATIAQVPPNHLIGQMANMSAEALQAAEVQQTRKIGERKALFGESWEQTLRLSDYVAGNKAAMDDTSAQVVWRDTEGKSLAATVDALGKLTQMLGVPPQALWEKVPGVTQQDVAEWRAEAATADPLGQLNALLTEQSAGLMPPEPMPMVDGDNT